MVFSPGAMIKHNKTISTAVVAATLHSTNTNQSPRRPPPPELAGHHQSPTPLHPFLHHKDWLSPTQVQTLFTTLPSSFLLSSLAHLSTRKDFNPNEPLFALILTKLSHSHLFSHIDSLLSYLKTLTLHPPLSDDFFHQVIKSYGNAGGLINKAIEVLSDMNRSFRCWPSARTFNYVLNLLVNTKQFRELGRVFERAGELGVEVDACSLNILIKGLCGDGRFEAAYKVFDEMPMQGCVPNVRTYCGIINGLCEHKRVDEAFRWFDRMEREGVWPDTITFNVLISGLCKVGRVDEAIGMLDKMMLKGCEPNSGSYQQVLYGLLRAESYVMARMFMDRMIVKGYKPSFESYKLMVMGLCKEKLIEDADWLLKNMVQHGLKPRMGMWKSTLEAMLSVNCGFCCSLIDEIVP